MISQIKAPIILIAALFARQIAARTDLVGCVSSQTVAFGGASLIWYVPDTCEICAFIDCGGGTAPPITTQPGCPLYTGTATYSPSYLPGCAGSATPSPTATSNNAPSQPTTFSTITPAPLLSTSDTVFVVSAASTEFPAGTGSSAAADSSVNSSQTSGTFTVVSSSIGASTPVAASTSTSTTASSSTATTTGSGNSASTTGSGNSATGAANALNAAAAKGALSVFAGFVSGLLML